MNQRARQMTCALGWMLWVLPGCRGQNPPGTVAPEGGQAVSRAALLAAPVPSSSGQDELMPTQGHSLDCYERARQLVTLGEGNAYLLCRGAHGTAPAECYERGDRDTMLGRQELFDLCRCAYSTGPVDCYQRGRSQTFLADRKIIALCSPIATFGLQPNCAQSCGSTLP